MSVLSRLREVLTMTTFRDPEVVKQIHETAVEVRTNGRLIREIRALQQTHNDAAADDYARAEAARLKIAGRKA